MDKKIKPSEEHDYGTITANRYAPDCDEGTPYTKKENQQRNKSLLSKLRAKGYGITAIKGTYFVADLQDKGRLKKDLLALGEEFEQDSIIFGAKGKAGVLFGTSDCPLEHYGVCKFPTELRGPVTISKMNWKDIII